MPMIQSGTRAPMAVQVPAKPAFRFPVGAFVGVVVKFDPRQEMSISSEGGGGRVWTDPYGRTWGYSQKMQVTSHTKHWDIIWLKDQGGQEEEFYVAGNSVPCRESHIVAAVHYGKSREVFYAKNITTGKEYDLVTKKMVLARNLPEAPSIWGPFAFAAPTLIVGIAGIVMADGPAKQSATDIGVLFLILSVIPWIVLGVLSSKHRKKVAELEATVGALFSKIEDQIEKVATISLER